MKKSLLALASFAILSLGACNNNAADKIKGEGDAASGSETSLTTDDVTASGTPAFSFSKENHDFGVIDEGTLAEYDFVFTNSGDAPLIINDASGSCGCTVPNWPKEPIAPGAEAKIHVSFNSNGRTGNQQKTVTLKANTVPNTMTLKISAQVTPKEQPAAEPTTTEE